MKLIIRRYKDINDGTIGKFELIEGNEVVLKGYTLEPAGEDTTEENTCGALRRSMARKSEIRQSPASAT